MAFVKIIVALCAVVMALILDEMYVSVPTDYSNQLVVRYHLGIYQLAATMASVARLMGFSEHVAMRTTLKILKAPIKLMNGPGVTNVSREEVDINSIPVTLFRPSQSMPNNQRAILFFHGDWLTEDPESYNSVCELMAQRLEAVVVRVQYRLAPSHVHPAGLDDACACVTHFLRHAQEFHVHPARTAVIGDGFGATIASAVLRNLKENKVRPMPKLQVLINPILQSLDFNTPSRQMNSNSMILTTKQVARLYSQYIFGTADFRDILLANNHTSDAFKEEIATFINNDDLPEDDLKTKSKETSLNEGDAEFIKANESLFHDVKLSPLLATEGVLVGMPRAIIQTCQSDSMRDDGIMYASRLQQVSIRVHNDNAQLCHHGWLETVPLVSTNSLLFDQLIDNIDDLL